LGSLDSLDPPDSLDSLGSLDSSYSLLRFIVSYIIVFEFRIPQEFRIHGVRTGLINSHQAGSNRTAIVNNKFCRMERQTFISCSYIQSDCNFLEIIIAWITEEEIKKYSQLMKL
jgi:hypothetical protein